MRSSRGPEPDGPRRNGPEGTWRGRLLAVLIGLVLCELGLRAAGSLELWLNPRNRSSAGGDHVILCHGDSNVFGVYEPAEHSYPGRLQGLLDEYCAPGAYRVVNLGVPGLNSRQLLASLTQRLAHIRPQLVLITIGNNNPWSWTAEGGVEYLEAPLLERLRLVKFVRIAATKLRSLGSRTDSSMADPQLVTEAAGSGMVVGYQDREGQAVRMFTGTGRKALDQDANRASIRRDLEAMRELVRADGATLVLVAYGADQGSYGDANRILRACAEELEIPLIDPAPALASLAARVGFNAVHYLDLHPRALGYEQIARQVYRELAAAGRIECSGPGPELLETGASDDPPVPLCVVTDPQGQRPPTLLLEGQPPGRPFTLVVWGLSREKPQALSSSYAELLEDPLFQACLGEERLTGVIDAQGQGRGDLSKLCPPERLRQLSGAYFQAAFILHGVNDRRVYSRVSQPVLLELP